MSNRPEDRIRYLDYLRLIAILAVIVIHVSSKYWYGMDVTTANWQVCNIYDSLSRWAVPVLVIVSGVLFLPRRIPLKKLYSKYILRLAVAFIVWCIIYYLVYGPRALVSPYELATGHYHMWFIPMIIGLYICLPIFAEIAKNIKLVKYFLILSLVFTFVIPEIITLINDFGNETAVSAAAAASTVINNMHVKTVIGYSAYFMLGYYLSVTDFSKRQRMVFYILAIAGFVMTILLNRAAALNAWQPVENYLSYFSFNVLLSAAGIFVFFKYRKFSGGKFYTFITRLSKYSFGAYLVHVLAIDFLMNETSSAVISSNMLVSVPVIAVTVFAISLAISALLNHIPFLNKYIV